MKYSLTKAFLSDLKAKSQSLPIKAKEEGAEAAILSAWRGVWGLDPGSVNKALAVKAQGPESEHQGPARKDPGMAMHTCNSALKQQRQAVTP